MTKKLGIVAAACFAFALCFALVGCGGVNKAAYVGNWELESGSDDNFDSDSIELMKSLGLEVTLTINEDGTGTFNLFGEATELTWDATSNSEGTVTFDENNAALKLEDGKLILEDSSGSSMTFAKVEASSSDSSASADAAGASESGEAASSDDAAASDAAAASDEAASSDAAADAEGEGSSSASAA